MVWVVVVLVVELGIAKLLEGRGCTLPTVVVVGGVVGVGDTATEYHGY